MKFVRVTLIGAVAAVLASCSSAKPVACTSESAQAPAVSIVKEQLERAIDKKVKGEDGTRAIGLSKIRAAIAELAITIEDIRTSKVDPNSTKRFCTGTLKVRFSADALSSADQARSLAGYNSVDDLADSAEVERQADSFTTPVDFNVQPTDDGEKVFAQLESGKNMLDFAAELLASSLLKSSVEDAHREQQVAADAQTAAQNAALAEQKQANLNSAKTENQLAVQTINAAWQAVPRAARARLLPLQRAWIKKKDAECRVEAASASLDPSEREVARLACDTRAAGERTSWLAQYRNAQTFESAEESSGDENY
jgi:uncharacterized protein YecT (DUF1311 family)